jgi:hypothetical protein
VNAEGGGAAVSTAVLDWADAAAWPTGFDVVLCAVGT